MPGSDHGGYGGGDGASEATAFVLSEPAHFRKLASDVANGFDQRGVFFKIARDIDMGGEAWTPIGMFVSPFEKSEFSGSVDGGGHTITNFTLTAEPGAAVGIFGYTDGASLRGIKVGSFRITGDGTTGALVGFASSTRVEDCHAGGEIAQTAAGSVNVGGLIGSAARCVIERCSAGCNITASGCRGVGGLVGYIYNSTLVISCRAVRGVFASGSKDVGGLVGTASDSDLMRCACDAEMKGVSNENTGGLAGSLRHCRVVGCTSSGDVEVRSEGIAFHVGAFAGFMRSDARECAACGNVQSAGGGGCVGAFCGSVLEGDVEQCAASGSVDGQGRVGGFVGWLNCDEGGHVRISACCSSGDIRVRGREADTIAGEFAGRIDRDGGSVVISQSYGFGAMWGTNGGFLGSNVYGTIINCFWRRDEAVNTGKGGSSVVPSLTTEEFATSDKFEAAGWDFNGDAPLWCMTGATVPPRPYPAGAPSVRKKKDGVK